MNNFREVNKCILSRRSIRDFNDKEIPEEVFLQLLEAASMAPNGCKAEPWFFYVIRNKAVIKEMRQAVIETHPKSEFIKDFKAFSNTAYLISVCIDMDRRWYHGSKDAEYKRGEEVFDNPDYFSVAAAIQNILLTAQALNLGTCWHSSTIAYREKLEKILEIKPPYRLAANIAIGHYDEIPPTPRRKPLEEIYKFID